MYSQRGGWTCAPGTVGCVGRWRWSPHRAEPQQAWPWSVSAMEPRGENIEIKLNIAALFTNPFPTEYCFLPRRKSIGKHCWVVENYLVRYGCAWTGCPNSSRSPVGSLPWVEGGIPQLTGVQHWTAQRRLVDKKNMEAACQTITTAQKQFPSHMYVCMYAGFLVTNRSLLQLVKVNHRNIDS